MLERLDRMTGRFPSPSIRACSIRARSALKGSLPFTFCLVVVMLTTCRSSTRALFQSAVRYPD
jgi:hypothetical protein